MENKVLDSFDKRNKSEEVLKMKCHLRVVALKPPCDRALEEKKMRQNNI